jgi:serine/threonine-protein kinase
MNDDVLREYLEAQDAGRPLNAASFVGRDPDLAEYVETAERIESTVRWLTAVGSAPPLPKFPGYDLIAEIGRGGMGIVYKAVHSQLRRTVALKLLLAGRSANLDRLMAEARATAPLAHPGIVSLYEVGEFDGVPFLALEFVDGQSLAARIDRGPVSPKEAARLLRAVAEAVQHAHEQGVIHRDLKPANILLTAEGEPKVTDFGLAKRSDEATLTAAGEVLGTPAYMPPEFAAGEAVRAGPTADVYGLGAVMYALLTGRPPFVGDTPLDTVRQVAEVEPVPPRDRNPAVDRGIQAVCLKCLEKNPKHRYPSAAALAADLDRYLREEPPKAELLGWGEWARRQLDRAVDFGHAGRWARVLRTLAAVELISQTTFYFGTRSAESGWVFWLFFLATTMTSTWAPIAWIAAKRRLDPREREILLFWFGVAVGQIILFADRCPLLGPAVAAEVYRYFPASLVLYGVMLFAEGRLYWGRLYLFGLSHFAVAALLLAVVEVGPLVAGFCQAWVYFAVARHLGRVATERTAARRI